MTLYQQVAALTTRPDHHLKDSELAWFAFDPTGLVEFAQRSGRGSDSQSLASLAECEQAAWECDTILVFRPKRKIRHSAHIWDETDELLFDIDYDGNVVSVDFLSENCDLP